jgi:putative transcriptional regulator
MQKMNDETFDELIASVKEAGKILRGEVAASRVFETPEPDVKAIREGIGFSQSKFAHLIGVNIRTLQNWEQGHRHPTGPAKVLLKLVQADPKSVIKNLHANHA